VDAASPCLTLALRWPVDPPALPCRGSLQAKTSVPPCLDLKCVHIGRNTSRCAAACRLVAPVEGQPPVTDGWKLELLDAVCHDHFFNCRQVRQARFPTVKLPAFVGHSRPKVMAAL
jgi:hypothetical protein